MHRLAIATIALGSLVAPVVAEPCAVMENTPHVLTQDHAAIADGGGIVVGMLPDPTPRNTEDEGKLDRWRFADKSRPAIRHIAPGLDVLVTPGDATLQDAGRKALVRVKRGAKLLVLEAPAVTSIVRTAPMHRRRPSMSTTASLTADSPATVVAIVVFDKAGTTARTWTEVSDGLRTVALYGGGSCTVEPEGTIASAVGDEVRLAWLDASGRLGKLSPPVKITAAP